MNCCPLLMHWEEEKIVGYCAVARYGTDEEILWIRALAVAPAAQGRGIGRKLLEQALWFGQSKGAVKSFLMVDKENHAAKQLYHQYSYQATSEWETQMLWNPANHHTKDRKE